ncbi:MAG: TetR/AcrR family transcriptional regulator [Myxococcales bacterium]|nr:TetR/AcrR family transcriptional regulator [Myxococcales bacterium]MCB9629881.1 TetR/AcrR family transcriptional regulator [Sandaracinaceae bacterium]
MRWTDTHKDETRRAILDAAGALFRERGFAHTSVADVMARAGRTVGGFYAHFGSKEQLLTAVLADAHGRTENMLLAGLEGVSGSEFVREVTRRYLSTAHRDGVAEGCPLPTLALEAGRQGDAPRAELEHYLRQIAGLLAERAPATRSGLNETQLALGLTALSVGGLLLARSVEDPALSNEILKACRRLAAAEVETEPS